MTKCRVFGWILVLIVIAGVFAPTTAIAADKRAPIVVQKAGNISALLPVARISRGSGKNVVTSEAKKGDELFWNDLVKTEKGGRARVTLADQSILSLGSQAELRIVKHDARTQQTALQLGYGRLRAEVTTVTRDGGGFQLRTPTAVAGVIGTVFGTDTSIGSTTFLCISGTVQVGSSDPNIHDQAACTPGTAVTVNAGKAPAKRPATTQEIQNFIQDTEPAVISALSPASALIGTALDITASGTKMAGINAVEVSGGGGLIANLNPNGTATSVGVHVVVDATATPGSRVLTFKKDNGQTTAAVFAILAPPNAGTAAEGIEALKKPYLDVIEQERQSEFAALNGIGLTVKQSADGAGQQLSEANLNAYPPLVLSPAANDLQAQVDKVQAGMQAAATAVEAAATQARNGLDSRLAAAHAELLKRDATGTPDDAFRTSVANAFGEINGAMMAAFKSAHDQFGSQAQFANNNIGAIATDWLARIASAAPRFDNKDKTAEQGAIAAFDAGQLAANASNISWVLCDPSYKPANPGAAIPATSGGCRAIPGYSSATSDFSVNTCSLMPNDYPVRLTVNGTTSFETYLHVTRPSYDDPDTRLRNLAMAYGTLKPDSIMSFFDSTTYPGYSVLQENIRKTMDTLSSMSVLVRISTSSTNCNEANLRADWQSNYSFKGSTTLYQQPAQQVTLRMSRTPGQGWFITDLQGENGSVQGVPPGPSAVDSALPNLTVQSVQIVSATPPQYRAAGTTTPDGVFLPSGPVTIRTTLINDGDVDLKVQVPVNVEISGALATKIEQTAPPLAKGATLTLDTPYIIPAETPAGSAVAITVTANPSSTVQLKSTQPSSSTLNVNVGIVDLKVTSVAAVGTIVTGLPATFTVGVQNNGSGALTGGTNIVLSSVELGSAFTGTAAIPTLAPGASTTVTVNVSAMPPVPGVKSITASVSPIPPSDPTPTDDNASHTITIKSTNLKLTAFTVPTLIAGLAGTGSATIENIGDYDFGGASGALKITAPSASATPFASFDLPAIAAGGSVTIPLAFTSPSLAGKHTFVATITPPASDPNLDPTNKSLSQYVIVNAPTVDLVMSGLALTSGLPPFLSGESHAVTFAISNSGTFNSSTSLTWDCTLIGASTVPLANGTVPMIPAGSASSPITANFSVPKNMAGNDTVQCSVSQDPLEPAAQVADNVQSIAAQVNWNVDLQFAVLPTPPGAEQMGDSSSVDFEIKNAGLDDAPAGWNVEGKINGAVVGTVTGPALGAGSTTTITFTSFPIPVIGTSTYPVTVPASVTINANGAVQETDTTNNAFSTTMDLWDFALSPSVMTHIGVAGRSFNATNFLSVTPADYPLNINVDYSGLPAGMYGGPMPGSISGVPPSAGAVTVNLTGKNGTVAHAAGSLSLDIKPEIQITQVGGTPTFVSNGPAITFTVQVSGGVGINMVSIQDPLPVGISTASDFNQAPNADGFVSWTLLADTSAAANPYKTILVRATDSGVSATNTPAGNVSATFPFTVDSAAHYVIDNVSFAGHMAPYTGKDALQVGENTSVDVTVRNVGNLSPTGTITLEVSCSPNCDSPMPGSGQAPAAGQTVTISLPITNHGLAPGEYSGTVMLTSTPPQAGISPNYNMTFETVDFSLLDLGDTPTMNVPVGGSASFDFQVEESGPTPFAVPVGLINGGGLTFDALSPVNPGNTTSMVVHVPANVASGTQVPMQIVGTNHGVQRTIDKNIKVYSAQLVATKLISTDSSNPIMIGKNSVDPKVIEFKVQGDYDETNGIAEIIVQPSGTGITVLPSTSYVNVGDIFEVSITADATASELVQSIDIKALIPATNPPQYATYTLWVKPRQEVDLAVLSVTPPAGNGTSDPWFVGQGKSIDVVVENRGSVPSSATDSIALALNGVVMAKQSIPVISAGGTATVTFTNVVIPEKVAYGTDTLMAQIFTSTADLDSSNNSNYATVTTSDWYIEVSGTYGHSDGNPLLFETPITMNNGTMVSFVSSAGTAYPAAGDLVFRQGLASSPFTFNVTAFTAGPPGANVSVTLNNSTQNSGAYYVQVVAEMKDALGAVRATRQATVHLYVAGVFNSSPVTMTASPDPNVIAPSPDMPSSAVQLNGPVPERVNLTVGCSGCSVGTVDLHFTDTPSSETSPQQVSDVAYGAVMPFEFSAVAQADGSIVTGQDIVTLSATNSTSQLPNRAPSPDAVGDNQFIVKLNVGDLEASVPTCVGVGPGVTSAPLQIDLIPVYGFKAQKLDLKWTDASGTELSPAMVAVSGPTQAILNGGAYPALTYTVTNNSSGIEGLSNILLQVIINSTSVDGATASKYFPLDIDLSATGGFCQTMQYKMEPARNTFVGTGRMVKGFYGKSNISVRNSASVNRAPRVSESTISLPDVQVSPADVTYTPSMPKQGDTVEVRFRLKNAGSGPARQVPVVLQVGGVTVASDTFDVGAGSTVLGALQWENAQPAGRGLGAEQKRMPLRRGNIEVDGAPVLNPIVTALLVIDPAHATKQASNTAKSAPLPHFSFRTGGGDVASVSSSGDRLVVELVEGGCVGLRFASGASPGCTGSADVEISVEDLGNGRYVLASPNGVADLGAGVVVVSPSAQYAPQAAAVVGHTYAVQLQGGKVGVLTVESISNPQRLNVKADRTFGRGGVRVMRSIGADGKPAAPGDVSNGTPRNPAQVYITIVYKAS